MSALYPNIERRDSGPRDATADDAFISARALDAAAAHHAREFRPIDLMDVLTEMSHEELPRLLAAVKAGDGKAAGDLIIGLYVERIERLAAVTVQ